MLPAFEMSVPAEARYRALAPVVAGRYAELAGCSAEDAAAVLADVDRVAADLAAGGVDLTLTFGTTEGALAVTVATAERRVTVTRALGTGA